MLRAAVHDVAQPERKPGMTSKLAPSLPFHIYYGVRSWIKTYHTQTTQIKVRLK